MALGKNHGIGLVFTTALRQELPVEWLAQQEVRVHTLRALRGGALHPPAGRNAGVLAVITGVGPDAAGAAAQWIRDHVAPLFVVNLGTAGSLRQDMGPGQWISPSLLKKEAGETIEADSRLPFPWPADLSRHRGGALLSVATARPVDPPPSWSDCGCVDMEAHAQAEVFAATPTSFHVLKCITDRPGPSAPRQYQEHLSACRRELVDILGFLTGPGEGEITVVIPVYNRRRRVGACLDSVLDQDLAAAEIIVVDDGSSDGTAGALGPYRDRIRLIRLENNLGVAAARNRGSAAARSNWIAFLDSDDLWRSDKLARQWDFLLRHPYYQALQCGEIWIRDGRRINPRNHHAKPQGWIWSPSLARCLVTPSAILMRKSLLEHLGGFDETLPACEDYDLWLRLAREHIVGLEPAPAVTKTGGHPDQLSRRYPAMDRFRVQALSKALEKETEPRYRAELAAMLRYKLAILIQGAEKRELHDELRHYRQLLASLPENHCP